MLPSNASRHGHVICAPHAAVMVVKKQQDGTKQRKHGKCPAGPGRFQNTARTLCLKDAKGQQDRGKGLVLQVFWVVAQAVPPTLRAKGPELRVAEHEQEQASKKEAGRPSKIGHWASASAARSLQEGKDPQGRPENQPGDD